MKILPKFPRLAIASAVLLVTTSLPAQTISESFDYALSSGLAGQSGGSGFSAAWASPGSAVTATIVSGLTFGNLVTSGNAVQIVNNSANGWGGDSIIARPVTTAPGTTYWASYLASVTDFGSGFNMQGVGSGSGEFVTGVTVSDYGANTGAIRSGGGNNGFGSALSLATTYLTIAQYTDSAVNAWIFTPTGFDNWVSNGSTELSLSTYAFSSGTRPGSGAFSGDLVVGGYSTGAAITTVFDEIRVGDSLVSVTPVPEPATVALLVGAGLCSVLFRRRRA